MMIMIIKFFANTAKNKNARELKIVQKVELGGQGLTGGKICFVKVGKSVLKLKANINWMRYEF